MKKSRQYSHGDGAIIRVNAAEALAERQSVLPDDHPDRWCWTKEEVFKKCFASDPRATISGYRTYCLKNARDKNGNLRHNQAVIDAVMKCVIPGLYDADGNPRMGRLAFRAMSAMLKLISAGVRHKYDNQAVFARAIGLPEASVYEMLNENDKNHHFNRDIHELSKELFVEGYWDRDWAGKLELQKENRENLVLEYVVEHDIHCETKHELMKEIGGAAGYSYWTLKHKGYESGVKSSLLSRVFKIALVNGK